MTFDTAGTTASTQAKLILLAALAEDLIQILPEEYHEGTPLGIALAYIQHELPTDISVGTAILNLRPEADNGETIRECIQGAIDKLDTIDYVDACDTPDFDAAYSALLYVLESLEPKPGFSELYGL